MKSLGAHRDNQTSPGWLWWSVQWWSNFQTLWDHLKWGCGLLTIRSPGLCVCVCVQEALWRPPQCTPYVVIQKKALVSHFWVMIAKQKVGSNHFFPVLQCWGSLLEAFTGLPTLMPRSPALRIVSKLQSRSLRSWRLTLPSTLPHTFKAEAFRLRCRVVPVWKLLQ